MPITLSDDKLKSHIEKNQEIFNQMIEAASQLEAQFIGAGFDLYWTNSLEDVRMSEQWDLFNHSRFYTLYNKLILPVSLTDTPQPGRAFKLFTSCFDVDLDTDELSFNQDNLILFFNEEIGRRVTGLTFKYTTTNKIQPLPVEVEDIESSDEELELLQPECNTALGATPAQTLSAPQATQASFNMAILGGFISAMGALAVALAFTALNAATLGLAGIVVASIGAASLLGGLGLFSYSVVKTCQATNESDEATYASAACP